MEELGLPELTTEQIEELCSITEEAAREYVLSKVPSKRIEKLNISGLNLRFFLFFVVFWKMLY